MKELRADVPNGYQQLASLSSATPLTVPDGSATAVIVAETQNVRWRDDGTAPTASVGMLLPTNSPMTYTGSALSQLKFIEVTPSAKLNISYYK